MSVALNEICELIVDCPHSTAFDEGSGYPLIRTPNIGSGYFDLDGVHRVGKTAYDKRNQRAIPRPNDLIMAREAPAGNVAIIPEGAEFCLGQRTVLIRPDASKVYPLFLNYYLNAPEQRHKLLRNANGATVSHVNMPIIRNLPIDLPSIEEQKRVASMLAAYDSLIENNRKQIKLLEEAAQRLYKEWFIDLRFPGHEDTEIDPETGLPEGWERKRLGELADYIGRGVAPKYADESDWHVLGQTCIRNNLVLLENSRKLEPINDLNKVIRFGDVLINSTGVGSLGRTAQVWFNPENITVDSHVTIVRDTSALYSFYLGLWAFSNEQLIESLHTGSTGQTELPKDRLASIRLLKPPSNILLRLNAIVKPLVTEILAKQNLIASLSEVRNRLLPRLMEGEIEL